MLTLQVVVGGPLLLGADGLPLLAPTAVAQPRPILAPRVLVVVLIYGIKNTENDNKNIFK